MGMTWSDSLSTTPISIVRVGRLVTLTSRRLILFNAGILKTQGGIRGLTGIPHRFCPFGMLQSVEQLIGLSLNSARDFGVFDLRTHADGGSWSIWLRPYTKPAFVESDTGASERFTVSWTIDIG